MPPVEREALALRFPVEWPAATRSAKAEKWYGDTAYHFFVFFSISFGGIKG